MTFATLALLRPWWFVTIPVIAVLALRSARRAAPIGDWIHVIDPVLLDHLIRVGAVLSGKSRANLAAAVAAVLIALALTGPAVEHTNKMTFRNLDETIIVLDLSRSITASGNLQNVRQVATRIAETAGTRPVALVVYAGDAYLATSSTTDHDSLNTTLFALDTDTVPDLGSHPERGLALARQTLADANVITANIVLISDGDGIDEATLREARAIRARGWTVHALFVPAGKSSPPDMPVPNHAALENLTDTAGGITADINNPDRIINTVSENTTGHLANNIYGVVAYADFGRWLLLLATIPTLMLFRKSA